MLYLASDRGGIYALGVRCADLVRASRQPRRAHRAGRRVVRGPASRARRSSRWWPLSARRTAAHCCASSGRVFTESSSRRTWPGPPCRFLFWRWPPAPTLPPRLAPVSEAAARTVTVAQRLVEDYATVRGAAGPDVDRRSDHGAGRPRHRSGGQPVRAVEPEATSERDLFASRLLSPRTPVRLPQHLSNGCRRSSAPRSRRLALYRGGRAVRAADAKGSSPSR